MMKQIKFFIIFTVVVSIVSSLKGASISSDLDKHLLVELLFDNDQLLSDVIEIDGENVLGYVSNTGTLGLEPTLRGEEANFAEGYVGNAVQLISNAHIFVGKTENDIDVNEFTTMAWIKLSSYGTDPKRVEIVERTNIFWMNVRSDTWIFRSGVFDKDNVWWYIDSDEQIPLNEWVHTAFSYDGNTLNAYINGRLCASYSNNNKGLAQEPNRIFSVGSRQPKNDEEPAAFFDGLIDEYRFFDTVLTQDEILHYMNVNKLAAKPNAPQRELVLVENNPGQVLLEWDEGNGKEVFEVQVALDALDWEILGHTSQNNFACTGLVPESEYQFQVTSYSSSGRTAFSNAIRLTTASEEKIKPVTHYTFDSDFSDAFGSANGYGMYQTDLDNNIMASPFNDPIFVEGHHGNALDLNNVDAYVSIPYLLYKSFSIAFWMKTNKTGSSGNNWDKGAGLVDAGITGAANDFGVALSNNKIAFGTGTDKKDITIESNKSVTDNQWHFIITTFNAESKQMKIYIDGDLQSETAVAGSGDARSASGRIFIGKSRINDNFYNGLIDDLKLFNVELNASEISSLLKTDNSVFATNELLKVYPNPASDVLNIQLANNKIESIQILDMHGRIVQTYLGTNQEMVQMDIRAIQSGIYLVKIQCSNKQHLKRIIVE